MTTPDIDPELEELLQTINNFRAQIIAKETRSTQKPHSLNALQSKLIRYGDILYNYISDYEEPIEAKYDPELKAFLESIKKHMHKWTIQKSVFLPYWCDNVLKKGPSFVISPEHCRALLNQTRLSSQEEVEDAEIRPSESE